MVPQSRPRSVARTTGGFSLVEVMIAGFLVALAAMVGVAYVARSAQQTDWTRDRVWANQKAVSILNQLRGYVEGSEGEVAADLDRFDDGAESSPTLTITTLPNNPDRLVAPDHPVSGNEMDSGTWRWWRQITVKPVRDSDDRDRRFCTVRVFRRRPDEAAPGVLMSEVSGIVQSVSDVFPCVHAFDLYVLALDNCPGWWVSPEALRAYMEGTLSELKGMVPGAEFRVHWITKLGYGRDEEYAPYANEARLTTDPTEWVYWYPGRIPDDEALEREDERYYAAGNLGGRINLDGPTAPAFVNGYSLPEPYVDENGNGECDLDEPFTDVDGDDEWDRGNVVPYAMADMQNNCMRWPDEDARFRARVAARLETDDAPTLRLLLDRMIATPEKFHNALVLNMHGELLPMPPVRNYSDAAKDPERLPGWRAVTHPERLRPARVAGNDVLSTAPRWRVYAYKTEFKTTPAQQFMPTREPFLDANANGDWDVGESYTDWNANGAWDAGTPITVVIRDGDFSQNPNGATSPSILVRRLSGGVDENGDGTIEEYKDWAAPPVFPESFTDSNGNSIREVAEPFLDLNGNGLKDPVEPWQEKDGNGVHTTTTEAMADTNGNDRVDLDMPEEPFTDSNGNFKWDAAEPWWDFDGNGAWTPPTQPKAYYAWLPMYYTNPALRDKYLKEIGEPWLDLNADKKWTSAEAFTDLNGNGRQDGGFRRGEMWFHVSYDAALRSTVLSLYGTPLETNYVNPSKRGLEDDWRLYDLDYIPCPTPALVTDSDRYVRDLYEPGDFPKNTARWTIEIPLPAVRKAFETSPGLGDGDASDRILAVETRLGSDLTTGTMWPVRNDPANRSVAYSYFYASKDSVPFSERFQFQGDPRHCPYEDLDARSTVDFPNGYNCFFDSLKTDGDEQDRWVAFDPTRLKARWMDRTALSVPRFMLWLRTALIRSESLFTSMTGFTAFYVSVGGDVGYDGESAIAATPVSGIPYGYTGVVEDNTFLDIGFDKVKGCIKYVRSNDGDDKGVRTTGYWWSKPWLGELYQDAAYATQWKPWGNLRGAIGTNPLQYHLIKRESITKEQQPPGTAMKDSRNTLDKEGCTALFLCGVHDRTFHHKEGATAGMPIGEGMEIGTHYGFPMPTQFTIKHPFGIDWSGDGNEGPEFVWTSEYPHTTASWGAKFIAKSATDANQGCGVVRLEEAGGARCARMVVTSIQPETDSGPAFLSRFQLVTMVHSFLSAGKTGTPHRLVQLPRLEIRTPTANTEMIRPTSIAIQWRTTWQRWDGRKYTDTYPEGFAEDETKLVYQVLRSPDNGESWQNVRDGSAATPGVLATKNGVPDPARTQMDSTIGGDESCTWSIPGGLPVGSHLIRVEAFRTNELLHYAQHMEKIYVDH